MSKRCVEFPRRPQDEYDTPAAAVTPPLPYLKARTRFIDPCVGRGRLIEHLTLAGHICVASYDLPDNDARTKRYAEAKPGIMMITNPPWRRDVLHPIIRNLSDQAPTWLLVDADWIHTQQSVPFLPRICSIVSIGRVRWIPDSPYDGKDNAVWVLFGRPQVGGQILFSRPRRLIDGDRSMIIRCHVCLADPCGRWKQPPAIIFIDRYLKREPVYACRDHLSARRAEEIYAREHALGHPEGRAR